MEKAEQKVYIRMMGKFAIEVEGSVHQELMTLSPKGLSLLELLILEENQPVRYDMLIEQLWAGEMAVQHAETQEQFLHRAKTRLKTLVCRTREYLNALSPMLGNCVITLRGSYAWQKLPGVETDADEIRRLCDAIIGSPFFDVEQWSLAEKLVRLGCKRPLFLRTGSHVSGETDKRGAGFMAWCQMNDVACEARRFDDREGMEPVFAFLDEHFSDGRRDFDGVFCSTDMLAHRVHRHLEGLGVKVPEDVQLIGYDGVRCFDSEGELFCSTIVQPVRQIAETAVDMLLREDRTKLPALICLPVSYAAGGTTRE